MADINNDNKKDILVLGDKDGCFWYEIPENPAENRNWQRHTITRDVLTDRDAIHAGPFPNGVGDLDKDGDADVVLPDRWLENQEQGRKWVKHDLPWGKRGPWGLSARSWIYDIDKDNDPDIIIVDCDQADSRAAWLENNGANPPQFTPHLLPREAPGIRGSFHSLAVADFDNDGDMDIFTAEQEDGSIFPGRHPRWYIWENLDGKGGEFKERVILDARLEDDVRIGDYGMTATSISSPKSGAAGPQCQRRTNMGMC